MDRVRWWVVDGGRWADGTVVVDGGWVVRGDLCSRAMLVVVGGVGSGVGGVRRLVVGGGQWVVGGRWRWWLVGCGRWVFGGGWLLVAGCWWLVAGGCWWLVAAGGCWLGAAGPGGWWLVAGAAGGCWLEEAAGWWLVAGGCWPGCWWWLVGAGINKRAFDFRRIFGVSLVSLVLLDPQRQLSHWLSFSLC